MKRGRKPLSDPRTILLGFRVTTFQLNKLKGLTRLHLTPRKSAQAKDISEYIRLCTIYNYYRIPKNPIITPEKSPGTNLEHLITFKVNKTELKILKKRASLTKVGISKYIRWAIFSGGYVKYK